MEITGMTASELQILQQALGLDQYGQGSSYRNHFCAGWDDVDACKRLVDLGFMKQVASNKVFTDFNCIATSEGKQAVADQSLKPPKLTPGQQLYQEFLAADSGISFMEWIRYYKVGTA